MVCPNCGAQISDGTTFCNMCGGKIQSSVGTGGATANTYGGYNMNGYVPQAKGSAGMSIASMVLGICSIVFCCIPILGLILGIVGVVLGAIAKKNNLAGEKMMMAGIICSIIGSSLSLIYWIYSCVVLTSAMNSLNSLRYWY